MELMHDGASLNLDWAEAPTAGYSSPAPLTESDTLDHRSNDRAERPSNTVVLQPKSLEGKAGLAFQRSLSQALQKATVILVDLIWIETTSEATLTQLLQAMQQAADNGKSLSFLSMDAASQKALDQHWENDITESIGDRQEIFAPDFEHFLENYKVRKEATMIAVDIASKRQW
ncbi:hypothetical protein IQ266_00280 [filamentous cyanobacterium LEGE 11480]|uniref:Uncharacterized protein n=1 Tax=Romeriopsis navalis LEGE 11480 TaxID=2777977 RepID=A0A928Z166_9CYAN|nr:hypothetical protein [Romeriopsis navalis]MBE9028189.1 hypothetical protein [Romeriopsis navalis LEGE 11480]